MAKERSESVREGTEEEMGKQVDGWWWTQAGLDFILMPVVLSNFQAIAFFYNFKINFFLC